MKKREKNGIIFSLFVAFTNIFLTIIKIVISLYSSSISILADALNNAGDSFISIGNAIGFKISTPKNELSPKFQKGKSRIEYIISLLSGFIILIVGISFIKMSLERLFIPYPTSFRVLFVYIMFLTGFVKFIMFLISYYVNKKIKSPSIQFIGIDSIQDMFISFFTASGLVLANNNNFPFDAVLGLMISFIIITNAIILIISISTKLLGTKKDLDLMLKVLKIVYSHKEVISHDNFVIIDYGPSQKEIQIEIYITNTEIKLKKVITDKIKNQLNLDILISCEYIDNYDEYEHEYNRIRELCYKLLLIYPNSSFSNIIISENSTLNVYLPKKEMHLDSTFKSISNTIIMRDEPLKILYY